LREKIEKKDSLPETQADFRKGRGTMDNMKILQQQRDKSKKRESIRVLHRFKSNL